MSPSEPMTELAEHPPRHAAVSQRARPAVTLLVEPEDVVTGGLAECLTVAGFVTRQVSSGADIELQIEVLQPDVVVLNAGVAAKDAVTICRLLKDNPRTRLLPVVLLMDGHEKNQIAQGAEAGADACFPLSVDRLELVARLDVLVRMKRFTDGFEPITAVMTTVATLLEADRGYSEGHCLRMANYARGVGRRLGLTDEDLETLDRGAFLHDIGMLTVPGTLVQKPGALDPDEFAIVQSHTTAGETLLAPYRSLQQARPLVLYHHERYDGSGYPHRLKGDEIPLLAQIVGLVDTFEAITSPRPHRPSESAASALDILRRSTRLGKWRSDLVDHLTAVLSPWSVP